MTNEALLRHDVMGDVWAERDAQDRKWGTDRFSSDTPEHWFTILGEEVGEVANAILEQSENYREELVQVAAVAIAAIEAFDIQLATAEAVGV